MLVAAATEGTALGMWGISGMALGVFLATAAHAKMPGAPSLKIPVYGSRSAEWGGLPLRSNIGSGGVSRELQRGGFSLVASTGRCRLSQCPVAENTVKTVLLSQCLVICHSVDHPEPLQRVGGTGWGIRRDPDNMRGVVDPDRKVYNLSQCPF